MESFKYENRKYATKIQFFLLRMTTPLPNINIIVPSVESLGMLDQFGSPKSNIYKTTYYRYFAVSFNKV